MLLPRPAAARSGGVRGTFSLSSSQVHFRFLQAGSWRARVGATRHSEHMVFVPHGVHETDFAFVFENGEGSSRERIMTRSRLKIGGDCSFECTRIIPVCFGFRAFFPLDSFHDTLSMVDIHHDCLALSNRTPCHTISRVVISSGTWNHTTTHIIHADRYQSSPNSVSHPFSPSRFHTQDAHHTALPPQEKILSRSRVLCTPQSPAPPTICMRSIWI